MSETKIYNVREARARLPQMIDEACRGEQVVVRRKTDGAEVELVARPKKRVPGRYKGQISFSPDAFAPLDEEEAALWEGRR